MTNTYYKYCANVFLAKCEQQYKKGDVISVENKYGKENEHIIKMAILKESIVTHLLMQQSQ